MDMKCKLSLYNPFKRGQALQTYKARIIAATRSPGDVIIGFCALMLVAVGVNVTDFYRIDFNIYN